MNHPANLLKKAEYKAFDNRSLLIALFTSSSQILCRVNKDYRLNNSTKWDHSCHLPYTVRASCSFSFAPYGLRKLLHILYEELWLLHRREVTALGMLLIPDQISCLFCPAPWNRCEFFWEIWISERFLDIKLGIGMKECRVSSEIFSVGIHGFWKRLCEPI